MFDADDKTERKQSGVFDDPNSNAEIRETFGDDDKRRSKKSSNRPSLFASEEKVDG